jgi:hypothetical protein
LKGKAVPLELEDNARLIELLAATLRRLEHEVVDVAQHAADLGSPEVADRLDQLTRVISAAQAIPEALAARDEFRAHSSNRKQANGRQEINGTRQLGEVMDAIHQGRCGQLLASKVSWAVQRALLDHLEKIWDKPDEGIWEMRSGRSATS